MQGDKGLNTVNKVLTKPLCVQDFLNTTGSESNNIFVIQGKVAISYSTEQELSMNPLNRGSMKLKYQDEGLDSVKNRDLKVLRSSSVHEELAKEIPYFKSNSTIVSTLISMNRLCEELSFFKNMRKGNNVWGKSIFQLRFIVNSSDIKEDDDLIIGNLGCMKSFLDNITSLDLGNTQNMKELHTDMKNYTESCKYITEWLIYTNILDIITNFMTKGVSAYNNLFKYAPTKIGTKKYDEFKAKLNNLDDVSVMLMSELLKSTQNLDVRGFGKQKKETLERLFPFNLNHNELEPNSNIHNNVLKMMSLLHAFINTKNWGRYEFTMYYRELIKNLVNELTNDHITIGEFEMHRDTILKFHKKYNIQVNKVKSYGKVSKENKFTTIESLENMEFIAYRELAGALLDMSKCLYHLTDELKDEKTLLDTKACSPLNSY